MAVGARSAGRGPAAGRPPQVARLTVHGTVPTPPPDGDNTFLIRNTFPTRIPNFYHSGGFVLWTEAFADYFQFLFFYCWTLLSPS